MPTTSCPLPGSVPPRFARLTKPQQRVAIARDVIKQLKAKKLKAALGVFVSFQSEETLETTLASTPSITVKELMARRKVKTCEVCALGGLMMAQFSVNGDCRVADLGVESGIDWDTRLPDNRLTPYTSEAFEHCDTNVATFSPFILTYFDAAQLELIEIAFECGAGAFSCAYAVDEWKSSGYLGYFASYVENAKSTLTIEQCAAAIRFGRRHHDDHNRLVAVMEAIIKGKGTFVP